MLEQVEELGRVALLAHADTDERPLRAEAADESGEEVRADALEDAHAQRSARALGERGHVGASRIEPRDDRVGVAQQEEPRLGGLNAARAARAMEQLLPDDALQLRDLLAHGRLGARAADGLEGGEMPQFDAE